MSQHSSSLTKKEKKFKDQNNMEDQNYTENIEGVETNILLQGTEYVFIIHDNTPYIRRLDQETPTKNEINFVHNYLELEGWF